jgi:hypothetical protein
MEQLVQVMIIGFTGELRTQNSGFRMKRLKALLF